ncbi:MAG: hypothetical protein GY851_07305 [bacterium]|nr:hypothetical protein [bacterium]
MGTLTAMRIATAFATSASIWMAILYPSMFWTVAMLLNLAVALWWWTRDDDV